MADVVLLDDDMAGVVLLDDDMAGVILLDDDMAGVVLLDDDEETQAAEQPDKAVQEIVHVPHVFPVHYD